MVKRKVKRDVDIEMGKLDKAPKANEGGGSSARFGLTCPAYIHD